MDYTADQIYATALGVDPGWAKCGVGAVRILRDGRYASAGVRLIQTQKEKGKRFEKLRVSMDDERRHRTYFLDLVEAVRTVQPNVIGVECYTIYEPIEYKKLRDAAVELFNALRVPSRRVRGQSLSTPWTTLQGFVEDLQANQGFPRVLTALRKLQSATAAFSEKPGQGAAAKTYGVYTSTIAVGAAFDIPVYVFMPADLKARFCSKSNRTKEAVERGLLKVIPDLEETVQTKIKARTMQNHVYDAVGHGVLAMEQWLKWTATMSPAGSVPQPLA